MPIVLLRIIYVYAITNLTSEIYHFSLMIYKNPNGNKSYIISLIIELLNAIDVANVDEYTRAKNVYSAFSYVMESQIFS
jgi:hypothetical protein